MLLSAILKTTKGSSKQTIEEISIEEFVTDTRKISNPSSAIFIALKAIRDGHDFIADAYEKGIRYFLISDKAFNTSLYPYAVFIYVDNTLLALQQIAAAHRNQFDIPVIGISGSNGKTIIKEWLGQLLMPEYNIVKSPKSYNSQIGVALSILKIRPEHNLGIFEAGISQPGEMSKLYNMIKPSIGIFTNINEAHSAGFLNERQKINEKLQLFSTADLLIYNKDYHELHENIINFSQKIKERKENGIQLFDWSYNTAAALKISQLITHKEATTINAIYQHNEISITIPFRDKAYIENAIHCWCVLLYLGIANDVIAEKMKQLQPIAMRLELKHGVNNSMIINDTYNSDLTSLNIALDFLIQQPNKEKVLILSDMLQIGKPDMEVYNDVANEIVHKHIHNFIGIGTAIRKHKHIFEKLSQVNSLFFDTTEEFLLNIHQINFDNKAILLKGSRAFKFERIEKILVEKNHNTILEISLTDMLHNLKTYRSKLKPNVKTMAMVKAYSYGSGSAEIANELEMAGVDYLTVAYIDEGIDLRANGIKLPIMVMNPALNMMDRMIIWQLEPEIYNKSSLLQIIEATSAMQLKDYPIHIKLDTGMHRLGFQTQDLDEIIAIIKSANSIKIKSIFTHLVGSDDNSFDDFTKKQHQLYDEMSSKIVNAFDYKILRHISNTAAITCYPEYQYDMVRLGIGLYGIDMTNTIQNELKPIGVLKTHITQIKKIPQNETVGYSRRGVLKRDSIIATVNIGYADGYFRDFGNGNAYMLVNGQKAPVVGVVCMDMCMLDVTDIPNVTEGDEVIVFGKELPIQQLAEWAHTIPYEILTGISQRVKRIYLND
jgi:alanine racemase